MDSWAETDKTYKGHKPHLSFSRFEICQRQTTITYKAG